MKKQDLSSIEIAKAEKKLIHKSLTTLKAKKSIDLDAIFHQKHHFEFSKMDCLTCANCCKTTSPIFRDADIRRISKYLKLRESKFISDYLKLDEDHDWVLKSSPCVFLQEDNACSIYDFRPLACKEYPHTNRKNMHQIMEITIKNSLICPVVARITYQITKEK